MGYRKPYYRKDGTYVSESWDNRLSKRSKKNTNNDGGCLIYFIFFIIIILIIRCNK